MKSEPLLTVEKAAELLNVKKRTAYAWIAQGKLRAIKVDHTLRVEPDEIAAFIHRHAVQVVGATSPVASPIVRLTSSVAKYPGADRYLN